MSGWKSQVKKRATEMLKLPPDALLNVSRVTCVDGKTVVVENAQGLMKVEQNCVVLSLGARTLQIHGGDFEVTLVTEREVHIKGRVEHIDYAGNEQVTL